MSMSGAQLDDLMRSVLAMAEESQKLSMEHRRSISPREILEMQYGSGGSVDRGWGIGGAAGAERRSREAIAEMQHGIEGSEDRRLTNERLLQETRETGATTRLRLGESLERTKRGEMEAAIRRGEERGAADRLRGGGFQEAPRPYIGKTTTEQGAEIPWTLERGESGYFGRKVPLVGQGLTEETSSPVTKKKKKPLTSYYERP